MKAFKHRVTSASHPIPFQHSVRVSAVRNVVGGTSILNRGHLSSEVTCQTSGQTRRRGLESSDTRLRDTDAGHHHRTRSLYNIINCINSSDNTRAWRGSPSPLPSSPTPKEGEKEERLERGERGVAVGKHARLNSTTTSSRGCHEDATRTLRGHCFRGI